MRFILISFLMLTLSSCAFLGVPGKYKAWSTEEVNLAPTKEFKLQTYPDGSVALEPVFITTDGRHLDNLNFPDYVWGKSYRLQTREVKFVNRRGIMDAPHRGREPWS